MQRMPTGPRSSCSNDRMEQSDEMLVQQVVGLDDRAAFDLLIQRHQARILLLQKQFCRDATLAQDLCQETFLRAWRKLATFDNRGRFAAWLAKLAYNVFLQHLRRNRIARESELPETAATAEFEARSEDNPELLDLERLLAVVSLEEQIVLVLNYAHGLSNSEIATLLNTPEGTVKSQIHRAKQKIREHFNLNTASTTIGTANLNGAAG